MLSSSSTAERFASTASRTRVGMLAALVGMWTIAACVELSPYACLAESACVEAGVHGTCEASGYCSFPDANCPSQRRYSGLAGGGLANACVPEPSESTTGDDAAAGTSTTQASTESGAAATCGNGVVEAGEECDDDNTVDGDGCGSTCLLPGSPIWEVTYTHPHGGRENANRVAMLGGGDVAVVGYMEVGEGDSDAFWGRFSGDDGAEVWSKTRTFSSPSGDEARAVAISAANRIFVGGIEGPGGARQGFVEHFDADGTLVYEVLPELENVTALVANEGGVMAFGRGPSVDGAAVGAAVVTYGEFNTSVRWRAFTGDASHFTAAASADFDEAYGAASAQDDIVLYRITPGGAEELARFAGDFGGIDVAQGLAHFPGSELVALGGFVTTPFAHDVWLGAFAPDGQSLWSDTYRESDLMVSEEIEDLVISPEGDLYVAGLVTHDTLDAFAAKYDPSGQRVWSRRFPEPEKGEIDYGEDVARGIALAPDGTLVIVGERSTPQSQRDLWIMKITR